MTDRELLELAAKAACLTEMTEFSEMIRDYDSDYSWGLHEKGREYMSWNPLEGDEDAFRLAVKLRINIPWQTFPVGTSEAKELELIRRAIVRAAAEIGRAMP